MNPYVESLAALGQGRMCLMLRTYGMMFPKTAGDRRFSRQHLCLVSMDVGAKNLPWLFRGQSV